MKKGDIVKGKERGRDAAFHYIIFLKTNEDGSFTGCVLTTKGGYKDNQLMSEEHFQKTDDKGNAYKVFYKNSHVVTRRFIKPAEWGPFTKVGELTKSGIGFVESILKKDDPIHWDKYAK